MRKPLDIAKIIGKKDDIAVAIVERYENWKMQILPKHEEWKELRSYLFATSTADTSNKDSPWSNTTITPKLTQIRDNLHANYMAALFSNEKWFSWEGASQSDEERTKREAIEGYVHNKARISKLQQVISQLLYDYIDYGNAIADVEWVNERYTDPTTNQVVTTYVGPRAVRISPYDIVINPTAVRFKDSPKITRYLKTYSELKMEAAEMGYDPATMKALQRTRNALAKWDSADEAKNEAYTIDGFGDIYEYYSRGIVEVLVFEGTLITDNLVLENQIITIVDRCKVLKQEDNPSWFGTDSKEHVGWRLRPDNLWAMGPLDGLVGLQYRMDHMENAQGDLLDMTAHPPFKTKGNVEEFEMGPFQEIHCGDDGDIDFLKVDSSILAADMKIDTLDRRMEELAGAPRQAMGVRTPGEKTAFEVQALDNAASRIFQEKIRQFEEYLLEPLLNNMLEISRRNMDGVDTVRVFDDDYGVATFLELTKEDITAAGRLYPRGSRHWAATNLLVQNLTGVFNSPVGERIAPHISPKALARMVESAFGWEKYGLVRENIGVIENAETQKLAMVADEQNQLVGMTEGTEEIEPT